MATHGEEGHQSIYLTSKVLSERLKFLRKEREKNSDVFSRINIEDRNRSGIGV